jgi:hypothetical protein
MTPDELWIDMAKFDGAHANRIWDGSAATDDAPAWYGRVATLLHAATAPATDDELAGESDIVARMQAAILDPAPDDELAAESDIVARMQAAILELPAQASNGDAGDSDRPRHLRAAGSSDAARRRQGVRVVRRIVAVKVAAVTTVVAIGVTAAAATTGFVATVVVPALSSNDAKTMQEPKSSSTADSGSSADGSGESDRGAGDGGAPVFMDPEEPLACMLDLDCLIQEVQEAAENADPAAEASALVDAPLADATTDATVLSETPTETTLATEPPPETSTTTTTEPPTATTEPPTTTTTTTTMTTPTDPPPVDAAAPASGDTSSDTGTGATAAAAHRASRPSPAG